MSYAAHAMESYLSRTSTPPATALDAAYNLELQMLREMLCRLEAILDDEDVPRETSQRVIRSMLYGSPSPAAAEHRMAQEREIARILRERPRVPIDISHLSSSPGARR